MVVNNSSKAHLHQLLTLMILGNFINCGDLVFTEKTHYDDISFRSILPKWNLHLSKFHFTWSHVNANNESSLHRIEVLPQSEI